MKNKGFVQVIFPIFISPINFQEMNDMSKFKYVKDHRPPDLNLCKMHEVRLNFQKAFL